MKTEPIIKFESNAFLCRVCEMASGHLKREQYASPNNFIALCMHWMKNNRKQNINDNEILLFALLYLGDC